jgi:RNA polymerase sigma-70 factor (ECF subfamily)
LPAQSAIGRLEQAVLPHLDAAYNLARWLMGGGPDAEDAVQEAYLRALRYADSFRGTDARPWLLSVVRNTCYTLLRAKRELPATTPYDEDRHAPAAAAGPDARLLRQEDRRLVREALKGLSVEFREVVVLRELEGLSYKEIARVTGVPLGTVMSRLARGRDQLLDALIRGRKDG